MDRAWQIASSATVVGQVINMITHPEKILFPGEGITKGEFAAYHEMIAPFMLPHVRGRPITMERYHRGIGADGFFQKDVVKGFPEWLERVEVPKKDGTVHHPIANDARSLIWLANQNSITIHVWASRVPKLYYPDICIFDLDPSTEDDAEGLRSTALNLRELLCELGLPSWVKTSGSKGFHIAVPLDGKANYGVVARFAHRVLASLCFPDRLAHRVANLAGLGLPNRPADRVIPCAGFPDRLAHCIANFSCTGFRDVPDTVDHAIFADPVPACLVAGDLLLIVFDAANGLHHGVTPHLAARCTTAVTRRAAEPGIRLLWDKRYRQGCGKRNHPSSHLLRLLLVQFAGYFSGLVGMQTRSPHSSNSG